MQFSEDSNRWYLSLDDGYVGLLQIGYQLNLSLRDGLDEAFVQLEGPFRLSGPGVDVRLDPEEFANLGPALALFMKKVTCVEIRKLGQLQVRFDDGHSIEAGSDEAYEAWQVGGSFIGARLICVPGGEVVVFKEATHG